MASFKLPFILAPHQAKVRNAIVHGIERVVDGKAVRVFLRFFVLVCGRRSGKTLAAVYITVEHLTTHPESVAWWVAPTFPLARKGFRETIHFLRSGQKHLVRRVLRAERRIEFVNGSFLEFRSAEHPDSLVSEGLDWLVVDEAALIEDEDVWSQYLRPALADREGKALLITSPRGLNWLYELWRRGQDALDREVLSWRYPTGEAGFVSQSELEKIRRTTPEQTFAQEYSAEFRADAGAVFRNVDACTGPLGRSDAYTVLGVDLAYVQDFTVLWAMNSAHETVEVTRFQQLDWSLQRLRIVEAYRRLKARKVLIDVTGILGWDAVSADLSREGVQVEPVKLTNDSKYAMVQNLMLKFDQVSIRIPDDPVVKVEFKGFTYDKLPSGRYRYRAPSDRHDDTVLACALAAWGLRHLHGKPKPTPPTPGSPDDLYERAVRAHRDRGKSPWAA